MHPPLGIYVHFPFCRAICTYCDFYKVRIQRQEQLESFLRAARREIEGCAAQLPESERRFDSVFLGGGTPSLMSPAEVSDLLAMIHRHFHAEGVPEISLEVNPETSFSWLREYRQAGVNRISFGVQSLEDRLLLRLGREHTGERAMEAFRVARAAGFRNINLDLIGGLPGQTVARWCRQLESILSLRPDHLSVYLLDVDKNTPLGLDFRNGRIRLPDEEVLLEIYRRTLRMVESAGFRQYEISSFCLPGKAGRHNLKYWQDQPYLGIGPGAHGYLRGQRYSHPGDFREYLARPIPRLPLRIGLDSVARRERAEEAAIFGLRLLEGIDLGKIEQRYRVSLQQHCREALAPFLETGLLTRERDGRIRLQERGFLLSNEVFGAILANSEPRP